MVKVEISYKCDQCGKEKKEFPIIKKKGYEDINFLVENHDSAYMPDGWWTVSEGLYCENCSSNYIEIPEGF